MTNVCGTGDWNGPKPGDPDNNSILSTSPAFGGIDVSWSLPTVNGFAVAHVIVYRGLLETFNGAIQIAVAGGDSYYDKLESSYTYYYWIRIVSINGTNGELIGPASAVARPTIEQTIEQLTGLIDEGTLAQSLRTEISKITLNYEELLAEIANRISSNTALSQALGQVQAGVEESISLIDTEVTQRQQGQNALVSSTNTLAALNATNAAAILTEQSARVSADSALASSVASVDVATQTNAAAITSEATARASADSVLASQINTVQSSVAGNLASVQTSLQTNINTVNDEVTEIGARYTAQVTVNGLVGGFGVYNDGSTVEAGFDVDTFWVGKTNSNKRKPFIISEGETFIDQAVINQLTFDKLRDAEGSFIVENGKIKADYIKVSSASIDDASITTAMIGDAQITAAKIQSISLIGEANFNVKTGQTGARMEITNKFLKVFDASGLLRVHIGDLTA